jgi:PAS domain S-box-containing protein
MLDAAGNLVGVSSIARDITKRKRVEEQALETSLYARSQIEASLDPLVTISPEGKITDVNEGSNKVTGISREKLIGTDFSNYFTEPSKVREAYQQVFSKGFVTDYPLTIRHKDGRLTDVLYNASVYKDARGNVLGLPTSFETMEWVSTRNTRRGCSDRSSVCIPRTNSKAPGSASPSFSASSTVTAVGSGPKARSIEARPFFSPSDRLSEVKR